VPTDLRKALAATPKAKGSVERSHADRAQGFISWIESAKQPEHADAGSREPARCSRRKATPCCYQSCHLSLHGPRGYPEARPQWSDLTRSSAGTLLVGWTQPKTERHNAGSRKPARCLRPKATPLMYLYFPQATIRNSRGKG